MAIQNRYEFVMLFDVENGNPNGDPDAGNAPRIDPETNLGIITDVCLKRKIRNYVQLAAEDKQGYNILIKPDKSLNSKFEAAYKDLGLNIPKDTKSQVVSDVEAAQKFMCANYFDVRAFGAVMSTGNCSCGKVTGPVQITFAKSVSPVYIQELAITRMARTTDERTETGDTEMGRKSIIPYALYRAEGYISAAIANKVTGFNEEDLEMLWEAIINMFEADHSAARGKMAMRKLFVFKHSKKLGNAPSAVLFDKISATLKTEVPRKFSDYDIEVDEKMPEGVTFICKL